MKKRLSAGFTLLEMLLALVLGAILMATITTMVMPLLHSSKSQVESLRLGNETDQVQDFFETIEKIAGRGTPAFPTLLDRGQIRTSVAIQFLGTGHDLPEDANGDGAHGIANMDPSGYRSTSAALSDAEDDDNDGVSNEDAENGLDDDNDGLIDEDPGHNDDGENVLGKQDYDDNNDGLYDLVSSVGISKETYAWTPFIPNSLYATAQLTTGEYTYRVWGSNYKTSEDDNEDGLSNNSPAVTWSARLENNQLICTTPVIRHPDSTDDDYAFLRYEEYVCLDNVQTFEVVRTHTNTGTVNYKISLSVSSAGTEFKEERILVFP